MNIVFKYKDENDLLQQQFIPNCEFYYITFASSDNPKDYIVLDMDTVLKELKKLKED